MFDKDVFMSIKAFIKALDEDRAAPSSFGSVAFYAGAFYSVRKYVDIVYDRGLITSDQYKELIDTTAEFCGS